MEWPQRLRNFPDLLPPLQHRLDITLAFASSLPSRHVEHYRQAILEIPVQSTWNHRIQQLIDDGMMDDWLSVADETP